jgi:hypothetical protein
VLGKGERRETWIAVFLRTGRKLRPVNRLNFGTVEPELKGLRKPMGVALHLLVQPLRRDPIKRSEVGVENDTLTAP